MTKSLELLESAVIARGTLIASRLRAGMPSSRIVKAIQRHARDAELDNVVAMFVWHDGSDLHQRNPLGMEDYDRVKADLSLTPRKPYLFFPSLEMCLADFVGWPEYSKSKPGLIEAIGRYFPILWNGAVVWLCVDLQKGMQNRIVEVDLDRKGPFRVLYRSFTDFLDALIAANQKNEPLSAYRAAPKKPRSCRT